MEEKELFEMMISEQTWEDIIYHIVSYEGLDPWDIDLLRLTDSFLKYIEGLETLDFRIPAKVVLVAAILLKLKSDLLFPFKEEFFPEIEFETQLKEKGELENLSLEPPIERRAKRKVTLDELIDALKKAMKVKEKKERMRSKIGRKLKEEIEEEEDIELRIEKLMKEIESLLAKLKSSKIEFSRIVKKWERNEIVENFTPLLHLSSRDKIITEQKSFFEEIFISKKG